MTGSNYPPGMSGRDFVKAGIDQPHHHEHEWESDRGENPIIENGAAIFSEHCRYVEGQWGEGWKCEKTRRYRFEYSTLEGPNGGEVELPTGHDLDEAEDWVVLTVEAIEEKFYEGDDDVEIHVDDDKKHGIVSLEYEGWSVNFRP